MAVKEASTLRKAKWIGGGRSCEGMDGVVHETPSIEGIESREMGSLRRNPRHSHTLDQSSGCTPPRPHAPSSSSGLAWTLGTPPAATS